MTHIVRTENWLTTNGLKIICGSFTLHLGQLLLTRHIYFRHKTLVDDGKFILLFYYYCYLCVYPLALGLYVFSECFLFLFFCFLKSNYFFLIRFYFYSSHISMIKKIKTPILVVLFSVIYYCIFDCVWSLHLVFQGYPVLSLWFRFLFF